MNDPIFKGQILGTQKKREDHWSILREDDYTLKLSKKDLISKWVIDNSNKLKHETKKPRVKHNVEVVVHFITRRERSMADLLKGFYRIMENVYLEDTKQIKSLKATYEVSNKVDTSGLKKAVTNFEIYKYGN